MIKLNYPQELMPPPHMSTFVGKTQFRECGENFLRICIEIGGLKPDDSFLDVGCGIGRIAIPLTQYLSPEGIYEGFDPTPEGIDWCLKKIAPRYPNFKFQLIDLYNGCYNKTGKIKPSDFRFPYKRNTFDFVILDSIFTHMLPAEMEHYFSEIARVMKANGRCLISYFMLNPEIENFIKTRPQEFIFIPTSSGYRTINMEIHEGAVAYDENYILKLYDLNGLKIIKPIYYGTWCGRDKILEHQDLILATK
jgi:SAM-dependent methyltransferase